MWMEAFRVAFVGFVVVFVGLCLLMAGVKMMSFFSRLVEKRKKVTT